MRFLIVLLLSVLTLSCHRASRLETFYPVPDFSLTDQTDKTVTLHELKGKVWVADFIFTNCGGTCPVMTERCLAASGRCSNGVIHRRSGPRYLEGTCCLRGRTWRHP